MRAEGERATKQSTGKGPDGQMFHSTPTRRHTTHADAMQTTTRTHPPNVDTNE